MGKSIISKTPPHKGFSAFQNQKKKTTYISLNSSSWTRHFGVELRRCSKVVTGGCRVVGMWLAAAQLRREIGDVTGGAGRRLVADLPGFKG